MRETLGDILGTFIVIGAGKLSGLVGLIVAQRDGREGCALGAKAPRAVYYGGSQHVTQQAQTAIGN